MDERDEVLTLIDEDGEEIQFKMLDEVRFNGDRYVALAEIDPSGEEAEEYIILMEDPAEETYVGVENEEIFDAVSNLFDRRWQDDTVIMEDSEGTEILFRILDTLEYKGDRYAALIPLDSFGKEKEHYIIRVEEDGESAYDTVEEEAWGIVLGLFQERFPDRRASLYI